MPSASAYRGHTVEKELNFTKNRGFVGEDGAAFRGHSNYALGRRYPEEERSWRAPGRGGRTSGNLHESNLPTQNFGAEEEKRFDTVFVVLCPGHGSHFAGITINTGLGVIHSRPACFPSPLFLLSRARSLSPPTPEGPLSLIIHRLLTDIRRAEWQASLVVFARSSRRSRFTV